MSQGQNTSINTADSSQHIKANMPLLLIMAAISFILLIAIMLFAGHKTASASLENERLVIQNAKVEVIRVRIQDEFIKPRTVYGQLESLQQSDIGFELSGLLAELLVLEGTQVERGDVLAVLDNTRLMARKNELESALRSAKADAKLAKLSAKRINELVERKLEPQQRLDESQARLDASNAALSEVEARLQSLQVEIEKSLLIAPFSGQVVRQYVDAGTVVSAGQAIFSIIADGELEARFGLPEKTAFGLQVGQVLNLRINDKTVEATVKSVAQQRNLTTRTIDTLFSISSESYQQSRGDLNKMVSGDLVSLTVDIPGNKKGAWVPISALASGVRGLWTLYVVGDDQRIQTRLVSVEYTESQRAYVSGAISDGDRLVISGLHRLAPEQTVSNVVEVDTSISKSSDTGM